jgi:leader peptidase (prepilin peptidase)/N-methyltransferase
LLALSLIDLRYKAVPDSINLLAALLAIFSSPNYLENLTNGLLMAGGFSMLRFAVSYYVGKKVEFMLARERKRAPWIDVFHPRFVMAEAMGEGDIIVAFAMGALLGLKLSLIAVVLAALIALPASIVYRMFKKEAELPFIPFLALGTFFAYLFGERIAQIVF